MYCVAKRSFKGILGIAMFMSILLLKIFCSPWIWADPSFVLFPPRFFAWILRFQNPCKPYFIPLAHHVPIRPELYSKIKLCNVLIVLACCLPQLPYFQHKWPQMWSQSSIKLICISFVKRTAHRLKHLADILALISVYQTSQISIKDSGGCDCTKTSVSTSVWLILLVLEIKCLNIMLR